MRRWIGYGFQRSLSQTGYTLLQICIFNRVFIPWTFGRVLLSRVACARERQRISLAAQNVYHSDLGKKGWDSSQSIPNDLQSTPPSSAGGWGEGGGGGGGRCSLTVTLFCRDAAIGRSKKATSTAPPRANARPQQTSLSALGRDLDRCVLGTNAVRSIHNYNRHASEMHNGFSWNLWFSQVETGKLHLNVSIMALKWSDVTHEDRACIFARCCSFTREINLSKIERRIPGPDGRGRANQEPPVSHHSSRRWWVERSGPANEAFPLSRHP